MCGTGDLYYTNIKLLELLYFNLARVLRDRKHCTILNSFISHYLTIKTGFHKVSLIHINDIADNVRSFTWLFADDNSALQIHVQFQFGTNI